MTEKSPAAGQELLPLPERADFETWARKRGRNLDRGHYGYDHPNTQEAWLGWCARAALAQRDAGEVPVAWQWRCNVAGHGRPARWEDWSACNLEQFQRVQGDQQWQSRQLYTHPAPAGEPTAPNQFWLIERGTNQGQSPTVWWSQKPDDISSYSWVDSAHKATHFDTAEDAQDTATKRYVKHYAITSHSFLSEAPREPLPEGLTDEAIDEIAKGQDDPDDGPWFTNQLTKLEWRAFARDIEKAVRSLSASAPPQPVQAPVGGGGNDTEHDHQVIERLRAALQWYADGNHFVLDDDWDTVSGEPKNWLCGEESGMVEDGGVARTVLAGGHMVEGDDEVICEPLMTPEQHAKKLARVEALVAMDPWPDTAAAFELSQLSAEVERYEKRMFPLLAAPGAAEQPASAPQAPEVGVEPEYWQWRRKSDPWSLNKIFNTSVFATTADSEVRALYTAEQLSSLRESHEMLLKALNEAMGEIRACYEQMAGENHRFAPLLKVKIDRWDAAIHSAMAASPQGGDVGGGE